MRTLTKQTWLYRIFDADGALLYVGITCQPRARMLAHRSERSWFRMAARSATWTRFSTRESAAHAEALAIRTEAPLHNRGVMGADAGLVLEPLRAVS